MFSLVHEEKILMYAKSFIYVGLIVLKIYVGHCNSIFLFKREKEYYFISTLELPNC